MSNYMTAVTVVGDISDGLSEYESGERLAIQMNQFFEALGRPKEFEAPVQAVWAAYENVKTNWFMGNVGKWQKSTPMKQVGIDAAKVTSDLQRAYPNAAATVPSGNIPKPEDNEGPLSVVTKYIPWIIGGVAVLGIGIYVVPLVTPMIMARIVSRKAAA